MVTRILSLPAIEQAVNIPLLHVAQATADALKKQGMDTVGLLGMRFTIERRLLYRLYGNPRRETIVPTDAEQDEIHRIIFDELCVNKIQAASAQYFKT